MIPPAPITGQLQYHWLDPRGTLRSLNREDSPDLFVPRGSVGLGSAEFDLTTDKYPFFAGSYLRHINTQERDLQIPIFIRNNTLGGLALAVEDLHEWFDTGDEKNRTPGYFRVTRPDGSVRQLACYFKGGMLGNTEDGGPTWTKYMLDLLAPDPWPTAVDPIVTEYTVAEAASFGIMNVGRLPAYPTLTIHGPYDTVNMQNLTNTGAVGFFYAATSSRSLIVDMRPDELRQGLAVQDDLGANKISLISLSPGPPFWPLEPGANDLFVIFTGSTSSLTKVTFSYLPRYRSLLR